MDITKYLDPKTRAYYGQRGIAYRRGYLLHGPPGTGKTSLSLALAGYFGLELYLLHVPSVREDNLLERLFTALPPRCIVLLEDIDAVGMKRRPAARDDSDGDESDEDEDDEDDEDQRNKYGTCRVTLSGPAQRARRRRIPGRPHRVHDLQLRRQARRGSHATRPYRQGYLSQLHLSAKCRAHVPPHVFSQVGRRRAARGFGAEPAPLQSLQALALEFSSQIPDETFTPAQLQGYLLNCGDNPELAAKSIGQWVADQKARMDEVKARAKKAMELRKKKRRQARLRVLARLKADEISDEAPTVSTPDPVQETKATKNSKDTDGSEETVASEVSTQVISETTGNVVTSSPKEGWWKRRRRRHHRGHNQRRRQVKSARPWEWCIYGGGHVR